MIGLYGAWLLIVAIGLAAFVFLDELLSERRA